ncbi:MAG: hypothetical protein AAFY98_11155 [Verrucomicrobiota bacterium]
MSDKSDYEIMLAHAERDRQLAQTDSGASPFRLSIDPVMRHRLKKALFELIDNHDAALEEYVGDGQLEMESYKEYIELFARCLRETMESQEGVAYLIKSCGFEVDEKDVNLNPDWRWGTKKES